MNVLGMGPLELIVILALALVVFGPDKLPELAKQVGRAIREVRRVSSEMTDEIQKSMELDPRPPARSPAEPLRPAQPTQPPVQPVSRKDANIEPPY